MDVLVEINLYLAEMYRINGQKTEYERKVLLLETLVSNSLVVYDGIPHVLITARYLYEIGFLCINKGWKCIMKIILQKIVCLG